ncbi:MAG: protein-L-isoaspartate(D-aspartate) O-methyltransferase [Alphaproteobacteria bacterium]
MNVASRKIRLIMELRNAGIVDTAVLSAIERTPRELFVMEAFRERAYENSALPIGLGQTISQPLVVAMMTAALALNDRHKVLEIGTGSGYQTAILSRLCRRVYTVERHRELLRQAEAVLERLAVRNVTARCGDGWKGWPEQAPFDRIIVTAAADELPAALCDQLAVDGIMVIPVGRSSGEQRLLKVVRRADGLETTTLGGVRFVPLVRGNGDIELKRTGTDERAV